MEVAKDSDNLDIWDAISWATLSSVNGLAENESPEPQGAADESSEEERERILEGITSTDFFDLALDLDLLAKDFICLTYLTINSASQEEHSLHRDPKRTFRATANNTYSMLIMQQATHAVIAEKASLPGVQVNRVRRVIRGHIQKSTSPMSKNRKGRHKYLKELHNLTYHSSAQEMTEGSRVWWVWMDGVTTREGVANYRVGS